MIDFDFHEIAFAVPLLACSLSALLRGRTRAAVLWALPLVFVKEDQGFTVAAIGVIILINARRPVQAAAATSSQATSSQATSSQATSSQATSSGAVNAGLFLVFWGIAWSLLAITVIIPHFNVAHQYPYWNDGGAINLGPGHHPATAALLGQVTNAYREKLQTTAMILLPVAFLALGSPLALVAVPSLALRFLSTKLFLGHGMALQRDRDADRLHRRDRRPGPAPGRRTAARVRRAGCSPPPLSGSARRPCWPSRWCSPSGSRWTVWHSQTYLVGQHVRAENAAMARVPDGATVETTLTMLAPLAARADTYWIGISPNPAPQYIVFDESNSGWSPAPANVLTFVEQRHPGLAYQQIFLADQVYVFRRSWPDTGGCR